VFCAAILQGGPVVAEDLLVFEADGGAMGPRGLYTVDTETGAIALRTTVAATHNVASMAIQTFSGDIWGIDPSNNRVVLVDPHGGALTSIGFLNGVASVADITFESNGALWAMERNAPTNIYVINLHSFTPSLIGTTTHARAGLTWLDDRLYAFSLDGALYEIDPNTGIDTLIGGGGIVARVGDAAAGANGMLYITDFSGEVFEIDPATGAAALINSTGNGDGLLGVVRSNIPEECLKLTNTGLTGGSATTWTVRSATPGQKIALVYGMQPGAVDVNGFLGYCAAIGIAGVNASKTIGHPKSADVNGEVQWTRTIPINLVDERLLTQVIGRDTCPDDCQSNILDQTVQ
jgi:outer membrane protein assembly factor BamB